MEGISDCKAACVTIPEKAIIANLQWLISLFAYLTLDILLLESSNGSKLRSPAILPDPWACSIINPVDINSTNDTKNSNNLRVYFHIK